MSVRAAREFLALRNDDHCHEDQIAIALKDVSGVAMGTYHVEFKPPDYRVKTVRAAIRVWPLGAPPMGWGSSESEAVSRTWRPLFTSGQGSRAFSFDLDMSRRSSRPTSMSSRRAMSPAAPSGPARPASGGLVLQGHQGGHDRRQGPTRQGRIPPPGQTPLRGSGEGGEEGPGGQEVRRRKAEGYEVRRRPHAGRQGGAGLAGR